MSTTIRPYRPGDREALVRLWEVCGLTRAWNDPWKDIDRKLAHDPEELLVADVDGEVVGSVMFGYDGHRGWIYYLGVHPEHRRAGHGGLLVRAAEQRLEALGCAKVNLQVRAESKAALGFYEALGFRRDEVTSLGKRLHHDEPPTAPT